MVLEELVSLFVSMPGLCGRRLIRVLLFSCWFVPSVLLFIGSRLVQVFSMPWVCYVGVALLLWQLTQACVAFDPLLCSFLLFHVLLLLFHFRYVRGGASCSTMQVVFAFIVWVLGSWCRGDM
jgi:hypothetical protein